MKEELIKIWERLGLDSRLNRLYDQYSNDVAGLLSRMNNLTARNLRNQPLYRQLVERTDQFAKDLEALIVAFISEAYEAAERKNDSLFMKYLKAAGGVFAGSRLLKIFNRISEDPNIVTLANINKFPRNQEAYEAFIKNNLKLSPRVWRLSRSNLKQIQIYAGTGLAEGRSAASISKDLKQFLRNPDARFRRLRDPETGKLVLSAPMKDYHPGTGVYRSSYKNALRLARTETNMAYRQADLARWKQVDFVLGYEVRLSASHPVTDICDYMVGKYPKNFVFTGFHVSCFCFAVPVLAGQEDFKGYLEGRSIPKSKQVTGVPPRAFNYVKQNSERFSRYKNKPFFLEDNFTKKNGTYFPKKSL